MIAYPLARDANNKTIPIDKAEHGVPYACVGCGGAIIPKLGSVKKHHFAHKADVVCDPDHALHESAKLANRSLYHSPQSISKMRDHIMIYS